MPRARRVTAVEPLEDSPLPGLEELDQDPAPQAPRRGPGRPRKNAAAPRAAGGARRISNRTSSGRIMSRQAMIDKVSAEVYTYLSLIAAGWEIRDPECAGVLYEQVTVPTPGGPMQVERLSGIAERLVAIIARNDKVLKMAADSGIVGEIAVAVHLMFPLFRQVWRAHGPAGVGHRPEEEVRGDLNRQYPAFIPA